MEAARIRNYRQDEFSTRSYDASVQELFSRWQPSAFVVRREIKPRLVQCDNATPGSVVLHFQHPQHLPTQSHLPSFLRV
jgi:hypothetical protein